MSRRSLLPPLCALLALCAVLLPRAIAEDATSPKVEQLAWLSGSWEGTAGKASLEEHWTEAAGGTLFGVSRTIVEGKTVAFEFLRIETRADGIFYVAQPNGRPPTDFKLAKLEGQSAGFENLAHDFPQRILYKKNADGTLTARIEGERNGKTTGRDFHFRPRQKASGRSNPPAKASASSRAGPHWRDTAAALSDTVRARR